MNARSIRLTLGLLLTLVAALGPTPAAAFHQSTMHIQGGAWFPSLDADFKVSTSGLSGDLISNDDVGIDDPDVAFQGEVTLRFFQRHTIRVHGFGFSLDGDATTNRSFNFDGKTYPVSTRVSSEADAAVFGADYGFDLVHNDVVAIGLALGVRVVTAEASINSPLFGEGKGEFDAALPALGVNLILHPFSAVPILKSLVLVGRLAGGTIGDEGTFIDLDGGLEWLPIPVLAIRIGYRFFHGEGEEGGKELDIDLSGPYVGLSLAF